MSDDGGLSWGEPGARPVAFPADIETELVSVWQLHADQRPNAAQTVWAGVEPAALFRSDDGGDTFKLVRGLWEHPDRPSWEPGFCGLALHTVLTHPDRPDRVVVAVSTGGVYRSDDGGETWVTRNQGIEARIPTEPSPTLGQCVHKVALDAVDPDIMWAQNHWGIYRTEDAGDHWESVGHVGEPGRPTFRVRLPDRRCTPNKPTPPTSCPSSPTPTAARPKAVAASTGQQTADSTGRRCRMAFPAPTPT